MLTAQLKLEYENGYDAGLKQQGVFQLGYNEGLEAGRAIAEKMYQDGFEEGLKGFRAFGDLDKDTYYHLTKLFAHLGVVDQPKLINKYKGYIMDEAKSFNG
jgi:hypothetical protein